MPSMGEGGDCKLPFWRAWYYCELVCDADFIDDYTSIAEHLN